MIKAHGSNESNQTTPTFARNSPLHVRGPSAITGLGFEGEKEVLARRRSAGIFEGNGGTDGQKEEREEERKEGKEGGRPACFAEDHLDWLEEIRE